MTNTYLLPIYDGEDAYIMHAVAKGFADAQEKFEEDIRETYDIEELSDNWNSFIKLASKNKIIIGSIYDLDEF